MILYGEGSGAGPDIDVILFFEVFENKKYLIVHNFIMSQWQVFKDIFLMIKETRETPCCTKEQVINEGF